MAWEKEARQWLQRQLPGLDISCLSDEQVTDYLAKAHPDGWGGFCYELEKREAYRSGHFGRMEVPVGRELPDTPLRQWARLSGRFRLRKGPLDELMMLRESDLEIVAVLKVHETKETSRRIKVVRQGIKIMCWKRKSTDEYWQRQETLETWFNKPEYDEQHLWGRIRDMERVASDQWQLTECYRPGTAKSPMDGAVRREEMSHKEFFGKVEAPTKEEN